MRTVRTVLAAATLVAGLVLVPPAANAAALPLTATSATPVVGDSVHTPTGSLVIAGTDLARAADALVVYTPASGTVSPANRWGSEAVVVNGTVQELRRQEITGAAPAPIPADGYVLSGHGTASSWLATHATPGTNVSLTAPTPPAPDRCWNGHVRLTYDDGPDPSVTPRVLDALRAADAHATFFLTGNAVQAQPELTRRILAEGHSLGNHTFSHPRLTTLTPIQVADELTRTTSVIEQTTGHRPVEWRPPYGAYTAETVEIAEGLGLTLVMFEDEVDGYDWDGRTASEVSDRILAGVRPGSIILMHDLYESVALATPTILAGLAERGLCTSRH